MYGPVSERSHAREAQRTRCERVVEVIANESYRTSATFAFLYMNVVFCPARFAINLAETHLFFYPAWELALVSACALPRLLARKQSRMVKRDRRPEDMVVGDVRVEVVST